jgi:outer membrane protein assembly factor BamB
VVYVGSGDCHLYAIDSQTGSELWRFETQGAVIGSPIVADGTIYFLSGDGNFYAVRTL